MQQKNRGIYVSLKCLEIFALPSEWNLTNVSEVLQNTPSELQIQISWLSSFRLLTTKGKKAFLNFQFCKNMLGV